MAADPHDGQGVNSGSAHVCNGCVPQVVKVKVLNLRIGTSCVKGLPNAADRLPVGAGQSTVR